MSILVKGMELPAECRECKMLTYYSTSGCSMCDITGNALARNFKPIPFDGRPDWCPLVEIPVPHGRLIDASHKVDMQFYDDEYEEYSMKTVTVEELLAMADNEVQTVIEAEWE